MLTLDLVRHMKALNRKKWTEDDDERPLSKLGLQQAEVHAGVMAEGEPIVAVYTSPALRCRETIEPLAERLGLEVHVEPLLAETRLFDWLRSRADNPLLTMLQERHPNGGRIVACSHGDTIPAILGSLEADSYTAPGELKGFGGWYRVRVDAASITVERFDVPEGFPSK